MRVASYAKRLSPGLGGGSRRGPRTYMEVRQQLLSPPLSTRRLTLREVFRAARGLSGDAHDLHIFGMPTVVWYAFGIRILGRMAVEVTRDPQAEFLARAAAATLRIRGHEVREILDPFVGSGNLLYHLTRATAASRAVGIDENRAVLDLTRRNLERIAWRRRLRGTSFELHRDDWTKSTSLIRDEPTLVIVMPPWGGAFSDGGLDLRKTEPPIREILSVLRGHEGGGPLFAIVHTVPQLIPESAADILRDYPAFAAVRPHDPRVASRVDYLLLQIR